MLLSLVGNVRHAATFSLGPRPHFHRETSSWALKSEPFTFRDVNANRKADALSGVVPEAPVVILVRPFLDQNVGAAARAMLNFGLKDLRLVEPECDFLSADARARAAGGSVVLENAQV